MQSIHKSQELASSLDPWCSVFVAANAGSGKTSLLTDRVLALLLSGVEPGKILCLTFTNGAAAEMSDRITSALGAWVMMEEDKLKDALLRLVEAPISNDMLLRARSLFAHVLDAPVGLRLQTIHGFCQSLLARFPLEAGVGTHLSVIDETTQHALLKEARMWLFAHVKDGGGQDGAVLHALVQQLGEHNLLEFLNEMVKQKRKISRFIKAQNGLHFSIKDIYAALDVPEQVTLEALVEEHLKHDDVHFAKLKQIADVLFTAGKSTNIKTADALMRWMSKPFSESSLEMYAARLLVDNRPRSKKDFHTQNVLSAEQEEYLIAEQENMARMMGRLRALNDAQFTASLLTIGAKLIERYDTLKRHHGLMDFDDQILAATRLLLQSRMGSWVMYKLDGGIDHVLVDEAQDTSPEQWEIVRVLTDEFYAGKGRKEIARSLFVVGDEKQSIFRFQGADPAGLATNRSYFMQRLRDAAMPANMLALTHSYRSAPEILSLVDAVFAGDTARAGLSAAGEVVQHQAKRIQAKGYAELWPIAMPDEDRANAESKLARQVAEEVAVLVSQGLNPGDVMILVRRRKTFMYQLARALKRLKIPVAGVDRMDLLDNLVVQDLLAFAQILLLPEDDLTLAALLKSPLFSYSEEKLFALCHGRKTSLWQTLSGDTEAYALLSEFRAKVDYISPFVLFSELLDARGYRRTFVGRMGEEYDEVIDVFLEQALLFERTNIPSMQSFIAWLNAGESEIKRDMEHAGGLVRIMTAHGAKGLQAKLVILADTTSTPTLRDRLQWHGAIPLASAGGGDASDLLQAAKAQEMELQMEEYRRLLYVALTRAEDMLIVCGAAYSKTKVGYQEGAWYHLVQQAFAEQGRVLENGRIAIGERVIPVQQMAFDPIWEDFSMLGKSPEEQVPPRPLLPSQLREGEPAAVSPARDSIHIQKGVAIHRMLQYLPGIADISKREKVAIMVAQSYAPSLDEAACKAIVEQALSVLESPEYAPLFGPDSLAEVPISGMVEWKGNNLRVVGQIDRLAVLEKEVWVIDFKSTAKPPASSLPPAGYRHQMTMYAAVLKEIYPNHAIRTGLLWTALPRLDWIAPQLLDEVPASAYI
jgi:ATP-dependent helicase/nuclease subunit A